MNAPPQRPTSSTSQVANSTQTLVGQLLSRRKFFVMCIHLFTKTVKKDVYNKLF
jgi:hypothetical protein